MIRISTRRLAASAMGAVVLLAAQPLYARPTCAPDQAGPAPESRYKNASYDTCYDDLASLLREQGIVRFQDIASDEPGNRTKTVATRRYRISSAHGITLLKYHLEKDADEVYESWPSVYRTHIVTAVRTDWSVPLDRVDKVVVSEERLGASETYEVSLLIAGDHKAVKYRGTQTIDTLYEWCKPYLRTNEYIPPPLHEVHDIDESDPLSSIYIRGSEAKANQVKQMLQRMVELATAYRKDHPED